ncbi:helix-turn-helix domain-containing protein [Actinomadura atramentaria]|uniref:helix-turn-helix domain-containing protein n=1 Tax=Actinomadura atramentaria TaxID=1990 RepID=UPI0003721732|nr:helix-turn-helix domain-containing protein [Actinomadura atramentaria]
MTSAPLTFAEVFALPLAVSMRTAARALDIHVQTAYRMVREDRFPCEVIRAGRKYRVPTLALMNVLGIEEFPIDLDYVQSGIQLALDVQHD